MADNSCVHGVPVDMYCPNCKYPGRMSYNEAKEFYTRAGELMSLTGHLVHTLFADDKEFTEKFIAELEIQMEEISEDRKILLYANLNSEHGQKLLSLLRQTTVALLQE